MSFFKKFFIGSFALSFILLGGSGTQSSNMLLQGGGFIGLIIGLVALYIFTKMAWKAMGCLPSLIVIVGIVGFIIYAIGGFNNGLGGVIENLKTFVNGQGTLVAPQMTPAQPSSDGIPSLGENFSEEQPAQPDASAPQQTAPQPSEQQSAPQPQQTENNGGLIGFLNSLTGTPKQENKQLDINALPSFTSSVSVITADTLNVQGRKVKIYGIAAPDLTQSCANRNGASYNCGKQAALWLSSWLADNPVTCKVMKEFNNGNMVAACALGPYDLGAALVNAGWAVADPKVGGIYVPYEENARSKRNGLWQGKFYMPWDWQALKNRKSQYKVEVVQPKNANRNSFFKF